MCNIACRITLDAKSAKEFKEKIGDEYRVNMYGILQFVINIYLLMSVRSAFKLHSSNESAIHVTGSLIIFRWLFLCEGWIRNLLLFISLAIMLVSKAKLLGYILHSLGYKYFLVDVQFYFLLFLIINYFGQNKGDKYFIHNHLAFTVKYHRDTLTDAARIVGFEVKPFRSVFFFPGPFFLIKWLLPVYSCAHGI